MTKEYVHKAAGAATAVVVTIAEVEAIEFSMRAGRRRTGEKSDVQYTTHSHTRTHTYISFTIGIKALK